MTVKELYSSIGDYDEMISRVKTDERIAKFVIMFLSDKTYEQLVIAMDNGDCEAAFIAAHTLKGLAANVSFNNLYDAAVLVTEELRAGKNFEKALEYMPRLTEVYQYTVSKINEFKGE